MGDTQGLSIESWDIPSEGWLHIVVSGPLRMNSEFYRVDPDATDEWVWKRWSMAGKPSALVTEGEAAVLDSLVAEHGVLSRLLDLFGWDAGDRAALREGTAR